VNRGGGESGGVSACLSRKSRGFLGISGGCVHGCLTTAGAIRYSGTDRSLGSCIIPLQPGVRGLDKLGLGRRRAWTFWSVPRRLCCMLAEPFPGSPRIWHSPWLSLALPGSPRASKRAVGDMFRHRHDFRGLCMRSSIRTSAAVRFHSG
jgi:hypothetical protein